MYSDLIKYANTNFVAGWEVNKVHLGVNDWRLVQSTEAE